MKKFLTKIWTKIKLLFGALPAEIKTAVRIGIEVTDAFKTFIDSPVADVLTALIPGTVDDRIKLMLRAAIPKILVQLKLADAAANSNDPALIAAAGAKALQELSGDAKSAFLHNLSIMISQAAADGKLRWQDGAYIAEWYYRHNYKPAA